MRNIASPSPAPLPLAIQLRWHRRLAFILIAASIFVLLSACSGGGNSGNLPPATGTGQNQPLTWDSGNWDNSNWT
jgi:hypothetical protein